MKPAPSSWFTILAITIIALGVFFRFADLEKKVVWHDEAYTVIRTTGYESQAIADNIFQNELISVAALHQYQKDKPGSSDYDTIKSLAIEDPQHPPFYFLIARYWSKVWGYNIVSARVLPIIISLISVPLIYLLSLELFGSKLAAWLSAFFFLLSPVEIIFAQIARQYSLLTFLTILASFVLLKAVKSPKKNYWFFYTLACIIGLYSHLFFVLVIGSHIVFICIREAIQKEKSWKNIFLFSLSTVIATLLYIPWLMILANNSKQALNSTSWAKVDFLDMGYLLKLWTLSYTCLFTDSFFGFNNPITYILRGIFLVIIIVAISGIYQHSSRESFLFIITSISVPFLLLVVPDFIFTTVRSSVTRYLLSCFPAIYLAVGYFLTINFQRRNLLARLLLIFLLIASTVSDIQNALSPTIWAKVPSYENQVIIDKVNSASSPIIISDEGADWTNLGDLLALSYALNPNIELFLAGNPVNVDKLKNIFDKTDSQIFLFRPSKRLLLALDELDNIDYDFSPPIGKLKKINP